MLLLLISPPDISHASLEHTKVCLHQGISAAQIRATLRFLIVAGGYGPSLGAFTALQVRDDAGEEEEEDEDETVRATGGR